MEIGKPIIEIRKYIHQNPELSREEAKTAKFITRFFDGLDHAYTVKTDCGYHGLVIRHRFGPGPAVGFRAELDALPIREHSDLPYASENEGVSHACGHDGHMSILLNLARKLDENPPSKGTVYFIFQSAEETGEGALEMVESGVFENQKPDICFALHNIPGLEFGTVYSREGSFACASVGCTLHITGRTAHAAHPEDAINPIGIAYDWLEKVMHLPNDSDIENFALVTPISVHAGEKAFGTSPAEGEMRVTMRAERTEDLDRMMEKAGSFARKLGEKHDTRLNIDFEEYFPATVNTDKTEMLKKACSAAAVPFSELESPFRWSEDFSQYSKSFPIHMFGLGSGPDTPPLHAPNYNFPDPLISTGSEVFYQLFIHLIENKTR